MGGQNVWWVITFRGSNIWWVITFEGPSAWVKKFGCSKFVGGKKVLGFTILWVSNCFGVNILWIKSFGVKFSFLGG